MSKSFAAMINCMDGRTQRPVDEFMRDKFGVEYVDAITEPGVDKILSEKTDFLRLSTIKERLMISVNKHEAKHVVIVGHHDCAGNPVDKETHLDQTRESVKEVQSWVPNCTVIGVWVDEQWQVQEITD